MVDRWNIKRFLCATRTKGNRLAAVFRFDQHKPWRKSAKTIAFPAPFNGLETDSRRKGQLLAISFLAF
jgi:hypothetical protein